jgi:hypothetical protein
MPCAATPRAGWSFSMFQDGPYKLWGRLHSGLLKPHKRSIGPPQTPPSTHSSPPQLLMLLLMLLSPPPPRSRGGQPGGAQGPRGCEGLAFYFGPAPKGKGHLYLGGGRCKEGRRGPGGAAGSRGTAVAQGVQGEREGPPLPT